MLWVKAFHIIFVVAWYAGLLYLPRLFVYHAQTEDSIGHERFKVMERKLFMIMTVGGIGALVFGLWLVAGYAWAAFAASGWFKVKLLLAGALVLYHVWCGKLVADFAAGTNRRGHRFYRLINEVPALILLAMVILVVVKPALGVLDG